jgi:hypothetical protein
MDLRYDGKMTDEYPAFVWQVVSEYATNLFNYCKVVDYLKEHYGRKKPKIVFPTIEEIVKAPAITKPKLKVMNLIIGAGSDNGNLYYFRTRSHFDIDEDQFMVKREGLIWVSEMMSQLLESKYQLFKGEKMIMEIK